LMESDGVSASLPKMEFLIMFSPSITDHMSH